MFKSTFEGAMFNGVKDKADYHVSFQSVFVLLEM